MTYAYTTTARPRLTIVDPTDEARLCLPLPRRTYDQLTALLATLAQGEQHRLTAALSYAIGTAIDTWLGTPGDDVLVDAAMEEEQ